MAPVDDARLTRRTRLALVACVLLSLGNVVAGCSDESAEPSTQDAPTRQAEPQDTKGDEATETAQSQATATAEQGPTTSAGRQGEPDVENERLYALQPTLRCLELHPRLTTTAPTTPRLRGMRDLAQRTSLIAQLEGANVGIAVVQSSAHAVLLAELLRAPGDPHRIIRRRNAVFLFLPQARDAFEVLADCLRPAG